MKFHHLVEHAVDHKKTQNLEKGKGHHLLWWQLTLIGIGAIIGAGFFLGTGLSIKTAGPSVLIGYLIGGITAYIVFSALAEMSVYDPKEGSFRTYAKLAYGRVLGFSSGWMYFLSGILIMSSEIIALSTFTQYWLPHVPLWVLSIVYTLLGLSIIFLGTSDFGKVESLFASIKLSTLVIFILFGLLFILGFIKPHQTDMNPSNMTDLFPTGFIGFWSALIFVFFSFGGIAVVGIASSELGTKNDIPKAGTGLIVTLVTVYVLGLFFVLKMVSWEMISEDASPFVTALSTFKIPYIDSIFNLIIITAAFSTMVGALFSITNILVSLAKDDDAPKTLSKKNARGVPTKSLLVTVAILTITIITAGILPKNIYEYITTAAGMMLILNWVIILLSHLKLHRNYLALSKGGLHKYHMLGYPYTNLVGIFLIFFTITGGLMQTNQRIGILITGVLVLTIFLSYFIYSKIHPTTLEENLNIKK